MKIVFTRYFTEVLIYIYNSLAVLQENGPLDIYKHMGLPIHAAHSESSFNIEMNFSFYEFNDVFIKNVS